jgi:hypothetical protein
MATSPATNAARMASLEDAFVGALEAEYIAGFGGSNFRMALEATGGSRALAAELGVSQRTVQRWAAYDSGSGAQARNPDRSPQRDELRAMADVQRQQKALDRLGEMSSFDTDEAEVESVSRGDRNDEGTRHAQGSGLDMKPVVAAFRSGAPMSAVGEAFSAALGASYGLPATVQITGVEGLSLR